MSEQQSTQRFSSLERSWLHSECNDRRSLIWGKKMEQRRREKEEREGFCLFVFWRKLELELELEICVVRLALSFI